jgi:aldehyde dehydrogenase (NAD+)
MNSPVLHLTQAGRLDRFFIGGKWVAPEGTGRIAVVSPSTEEMLCDIPLGNARDVDRAVEAAREAFVRWSVTSPQERAARLDRVHALLLERTELFAQALTMEMGAPISYARGAHVPLAAEHIRVARDNLANYPFRVRRGTTAIVREPIGVCALITPWNWPIYQITAKVGPALAAGCTVVLKPSELSPLSALLFAEVIADADVPAGVFNLVSGSGTEVGASLAAHPQVDMVSITGSTRAGVLVAEAAAPTVKRVAQELGGKSPNVVLPDADLPRAVSLGVAAAFRNMGQSCSAPTRLIVPRSVLNQVDELAVAATEQMIVGDPFAEATTHGPLANRAQFERVQRMVEAGIDEGAKLVAGGRGRPA